KPDAVLMCRAEASAKHNVQTIQVSGAGWIFGTSGGALKRLFFWSPRNFSFGADKRKGSCRFPVPA
ncbi:MAG: hypothetical protein Q3977_07095, partial [Oscillospiraceae bacterium]|nr:hypothetical protein [Oscillospiraceae bacterium]